MTASSAPPLALSNVSKAFRVAPAGHRERARIVAALGDVSLQAGEHEFVSLIGPSGCGKSTLLKIACGLMAPDEGEVLWHGDPGAERLGRIGYMPQNDLLLPWRRLLDNLVLGPEIQRHDMSEARGRAHELLPLFGLEGFEGSYPSQLSGGMRQRAALLRTFLAANEVLLLDEPFGALDALTRRTMRTWLLDVWRRFRHTIVLVTHDVDEAILLSDHVVVLSPRPATVAATIAVELPRPRGESLLSDAAFDGYRQRLLALLGVHSE